MDKTEEGYAIDSLSASLKNQSGMIPQFVKPKKINLVELYQNYQSVLNEEYILKLFYFTTMVQKYCFWEYIEQ